MEELGTFSAGPAPDGAGVSPIPPSLPSIPFNDSGQTRPRSQRVSASARWGGGIQLRGSHTEASGGVAGSGKELISGILGVSSGESASALSRLCKELRGRVSRSISPLSLQALPFCSFVSLYRNISLRRLIAKELVRR